ncbi:hypothetical protein ARMSODRAFT_422063 [Armillaria solidipes]|uniref:Uncharacterized protein n=1 Tax=Armillaria solidipes TaxID=1076256 RepID=A0A2H3C438_9AGAR|nr:hypothetical protein ARMSODRAFT_422063 [Armillaria solidipes]
MYCHSVYQKYLWTFPHCNTAFVTFFEWILTLYMLLHIHKTLLGLPAQRTLDCCAFR